MRVFRKLTLVNAFVIVAGGAALSIVNAQTAPARGAADSLVAVRILRLLNANAPTTESLTRASATPETEQAREMRTLLSSHIAQFAPIDSVEPMLVKEYLRRFNSGELHAIETFFSSALGRKYLAAQRDLSDSTQMLFAKLLGPHSAELDSATRALVNRGVSP